MSAPRPARFSGAAYQSGRLVLRIGAAALRRRTLFHLKATRAVKLAKAQCRRQHEAISGGIFNRP